MNKIVESYNYWNNNVFIEWIFRLLITFDFVVAVMHTQMISYPDNVYLMILIALWLYFFKLKLVGLIPLGFGLYFHYLIYIIE